MALVYLNDEEQKELESLLDAIIRFLKNLKAWSDTFELNHIRYIAQLSKAGIFYEPENYPQHHFTFHGTTGQRVLQARKRAGLTQKQLAERIRTTQEYIGAVERDERAPKLQTLYNISHATDVFVFDLIDLDRLEKEAIKCQE